MKHTSRRCSHSQFDFGQTPETRKVPAWRLEAACRHHRQFKRMAAREAAGKTVRKRLRYYSWFWRQRCYKSDPKRRVEFSLQTLERRFRLWKQGGCVMSALLPRYNPAGPSVPAWVILNFAKFAARLPWRSMKDCFAEFKRRGGPGSGSGRRPARGRLIPVSYGQLYYYFRGGWFRELQARMQAVEKAQNDLTGFKFQLGAMIRRRLPDRPPRKRRSGSQLSFDSSAL